MLPYTLSDSARSVDFVSVARSFVKLTASDLNVELLQRRPGSPLEVTKAIIIRKNT